MREQIERVLDEIRLSLAFHGGGVELVEVDESQGLVRVRLQGACHGCPLASVTLADVIETALRERVPGIIRVEAAEEGGKT
ncbi:MAG TPA: NifU family protein [Patescibacteria group bacterium]|nr:NifU family protein [Patescibacteria group bacterium]